MDGAGRTLIPGLIDAPIYLNDEAELAAYLAHGVTGVRNMSGYPFHLRLSERISNGALLGPDFITTGPILNSPGSNQNILQQTVSSGDEARAAVRAQHDAGWAWLGHHQSADPLLRARLGTALEQCRCVGLRKAPCRLFYNRDPHSP